MSDVKQDWLKRLQANHTEERAQRIIDNISARLEVGQFGAAANVGLKVPAERYAEGMERAHRIRARIEVFLAELGVPKVEWPLYWGYACRLDKIKVNVWGEQTLRQEVGILVTAWAERGCYRDVLMRIARELFELELGDSTNQERRA